MRRGLSFGGIPGVLFSSGNTWSESRRASLHTLRDFGLGKTILEDIIDQEVDNLIQHIEDNWIDTPLDVSEFFNIPVLASLWRIISGESLKIGDEKLNVIVSLFQILNVEFGNPLVMTSLNHCWIYKFINYVGLIKFQKGIDGIYEFCLEVIESHKCKNIDGDNPLTFVEAFLHKIGMNENPSHPLHGDLGEFNLLNTLVDLFIAGSDTTAKTMNWAMLYMIQNPEVQAKVREELYLNSNW